MKLFQFYRPDSVQAAIDYFHKNPGSQYIAGATNLLDLMKKGVANPEHLIDLSRLPLRIVDANTRGLTIGAMALNADVADHPEVKKKYPLIAQALLSGASPQVRIMATVGGNLLQRTRCPYFYDTALPCNKRQPGSGCGAWKGANRYGAIWGHSDSCVAVHPSDLVVALALYDSTVVVQSVKDERSIPFADFHVLPGNTPEKDNSLAPGEIITQIRVAPPDLKFQYYLKVRDRASFSFALVSVAVAYNIKDFQIQDARIALGGVAHKPWRVTEAEQFLVGQPDTEKIFEEAAELAVKSAQPLSETAFKVPLLKRSIVSALIYAVGF